MTRTWTSTLVAILVVAAMATSARTQDCFGEINGNIIIQAESTTLSPGWVFTTQVGGYSGSGAIMWVDPNQYQYQGKGILKYKVCASGGEYTIRGSGSRPRGINIRGDEGNDFYIKVKGEMVKLFASMGDDMGEWKGFSKFDRNHKKSEPVINLQAGCSDFIVAGRSEHFIVDKIKLVKNGSSMMQSDTPKMVPCDGIRNGGVFSSPRSPPRPPAGLRPGAALSPKCYGLPSLNMGSRMRFKLTNKKDKLMVLWTGGRLGYYSRQGGVRPGRTRTFYMVTKNTNMIITDRKGNCRQKLKTNYAPEMAATMG